MRAILLSIALLVPGAPAVTLATEPAGTATGDPSRPGPATPDAVPIPGMVARAQLTREIKDLEPVDAVYRLTNNESRIVYFTEIHDMAGQTVTHRWEYQGKIVLEVPIKVGTSRWRAYSSKMLLPAWTGEWKVSVVDAAGGTLSVNTFTYQKKPGETTSPSSVATTPSP